MTYDDDLEQPFIEITEADRPHPTGPPPSAEVVDAVWVLIRENPRMLGQSGRLYDEVRDLGLIVTRSQIIMAQFP